MSPRPKTVYGRSSNVSGGRSERRRFVHRGVIDRGSTPEPVVDTTKTTIFSEMRSVCNCNYLMTSSQCSVPKSSPKNKNPHSQHDTGNGFFYIPLRYNQQHLVHFLSLWRREWEDCEPLLCPKRFLTWCVPVVIRYVFVDRENPHLMRSAMADIKPASQIISSNSSPTLTLSNSFSCCIDNFHVRFSDVNSNVDWVAPALLSRNVISKGLLQGQALSLCRWPAA